MKFSLAPIVALFVAGVCVGVPLPCAQAAPGTVVVIAEGSSPQVLELGRGYLRRADEDPALATAFDQIQTQGQVAKVNANSVDQLKGLLQTAHDNGYATGLVTTGDVTKVAPLFYNLPGDVATDLSDESAPYDFLAGGGAANFQPEVGDKFKESGDTFIGSATSLDGELQGKILAPVAPSELNFSLDRDPAQEPGLSELATTALDVFTSGQKPFLLVIYEGMTQKALQTRDTPALFEQFREVNTVLADALARRTDNPDIKVAAVLTGSSITPTFATTIPADQNNIYFWISQLQKSFAGAGRELKDKTVEEITAFADSDTGEYKGWDVSSADKAKIAAGDLSPEKAIRASYEPVLKLNYAATPATPSAFALGFYTPQGVVAALKALAATPAK